MLKLVNWTKKKQGKLLNWNHVICTYFEVFTLFKVLWFHRPQWFKSEYVVGQIMKEILLKQAICDVLGSLIVVQWNFLTLVNLAENTCFKWTTFRQQGVTKNRHSLFLLPALWIYIQHTTFSNSSCMFLNPTIFSQFES